MKDGLASLLTRRTEQARHDAQIAVERWQQAIEAAAHAAHMADCPIPLPDTLTLPVPALAAKARTTDYISALHLTADAAIKRRQVLEVAVNGLDKEIATWKELANGARNRLVMLKNEHTTARVRADTKKRVTHAPKEFYVEPTLPAKPTMKSRLPMLTKLSLCTALVEAGIIGYAVSVGNLKRQDVPFFALALYIVVFL